MNTTLPAQLRLAAEIIEKNLPWEYTSALLYGKWYPAKPESSAARHVGDGFTIRLAQPETAGEPTPSSGFDVNAAPQPPDAPDSNGAPTARIETAKEPTPEIPWITHDGGPCPLPLVQAEKEKPLPEPKEQIAFGFIGKPANEKPQEKSLGRVLKGMLPRSACMSLPQCEMVAKDFANQTTAPLRAEVERLKQLLVTTEDVSSPDGRPTFRQGEALHELEEQVTAEFCTTFVTKMSEWISRAEAAEAKVEELQEQNRANLWQAQCAFEMQRGYTSKAEAKVADLERQLAEAKESREMQIQFRVEAERLIAEKSVLIERLQEQGKAALLPVASAPAEVPEGCVRVYVCILKGAIQWTSLCKHRDDTHFCDIRLPQEDPTYYVPKDRIHGIKQDDPHAELKAAHAKGEEDSTQCPRLLVALQNSNVEISCMDLPHLPRRPGQARHLRGRNERGCGVSQPQDILLTEIYEAWHSGDTSDDRCQRVKALLDRKIAAVVARLEAVPKIDLARSYTEAGNDFEAVRARLIEEIKPSTP